MRRTIPAVLPLLIVLAGCGTTAPAVDVREAHLARVPPTSEFVAQLDVNKVIDPVAFERWMGMMAQMEEHPADTACVLPLLQRAGTLTDVMVPGAGPGDEDVMVLVSGGLTAADIAACGAKVMGGSQASPPAPSTDGVYAMGSGHDQALIADIPGGGVVIGTTAGLALGRAAEPAGETIVATPQFARLRNLLGAPGDAELYVLKTMGDEGITVNGAALSLRRGVIDRYEAVAIASSPDSAAAISVLVMALPLLIAELEAELDMMAAAPETSPERAGMLAEVKPLLVAARAALADAQVTAENDLVRVIVEVDPAKLGPTDLMLVGGMLLYARSAAAPPVEPGAVTDAPAPTGGTGADYDVPGVPSTTPPALSNQPAVE
jgi:hypothetical protein